MQRTSAVVAKALSLPLFPIQFKKRPDRADQYDQAAKNGPVEELRATTAALTGSGRVPEHTAAKRRTTELDEFFCELPHSAVSLSCVEKSRGGAWPQI